MRWSSEVVPVINKVDANQIDVNDGSAPTSILSSVLFQPSFIIFNDLKPNY
jgi:hypothetical protein